MNLTTAFTSDYLVWDDVESATLTSVLPSGNTTTTVANTAWQAISRQEVAASQGYFDGSEIVFWLPVAQLSGVVPKEGDYLTRPDGTVWYLTQEIKTAAFATAYRVVTKKSR